MKRIIYLFVACLAALLPLRVQEENAAEPVFYNAFSHNDYWRARPLFSALEKRFNCVEADLWPIGGVLYVAHDRPQADSLISFGRLYIEPLIARIRRNGGKVYPGSDRPFYLMVDPKEKGEEVYRLLKKQLEPYREYFCRMENGVYREGAVLLFISGDRPMQTLPNETDRIAFLDGQVKDLGKGIPTTLQPVVSDNYADFFTWKGEGNMPDTELRQMRKILSDAHAEGKLFRWWGAPDTEEFKRFFLREGVDLVGADDLDALYKVLTEEK